MEEDVEAVPGVDMAVIGPIKPCLLFDRPPEDQ